MAINPINLVVDFNNRSQEDRAHAVSRPDAEPVPRPAMNDDASPFFEDLRRIESTAAWRRLKDLYQYRPGTHFNVQNRLTHTIIAQNVGEAICRGLYLGRESTDLVRAIIAAHDIGHAPFSHRGETALEDLLRPYNVAWNHDMAGLRVVHEWSHRETIHGQSTGLNLTLDVLEGLAKRYWRFVERTPENRNEHNRDELPPAIDGLDRTLDLHLGRFNHIEGQIAAVADWIAFTGTDIEDGLRIGELAFSELRDDFPLISDIFNCYASWGIPQADITREILCQEIHSRLIADVVEQTQKNIAKAVRQGKLNSADDVRDLDHLLVSFSPDILGNVIQMEQMHTRKITMEGTREALPCRDFVRIMGEALISGEARMSGSWARAYDRIRSEPPAANDNRRDARIAELVCGYMVTKVTDEDVIDFLRERRPTLYAAYFSAAETAPIRPYKPMPG